MNTLMNCKENALSLLNVQGKELQLFGEVKDQYVLIFFFIIGKQRKYSNLFF